MTVLNQLYINTKFRRDTFYIFKMAPWCCVFLFLVFINKTSCAPTLREIYSVRNNLYKPEECCPYPEKNVKEAERTKVKENLNNIKPTKHDIEAMYRDSITDGIEDASYIEDSSEYFNDDEDNKAAMAENDAIYKPNTLAETVENPHVKYVTSKKLKGKEYPVFVNEEATTDDIYDPGLKYTVTEDATVIQPVFVEVDPKYSRGGFEEKKSYGSDPLIPDMDASAKQSVVYSSVAAAQPCLNSADPKPIFRPEVGFAQSMIEHMKQANEVKLKEARQRASSSSSKIRTDSETANTIKTSIKSPKRKFITLQKSAPSKVDSIVETPIQVIARGISSISKLVPKGDSSGAYSSVYSAHVPAPKTFARPHLNVPLKKSHLKPFTTKITIPRTTFPLLSSKISTANALAKSAIIKAPARIGVLKTIGDTAAKTAAIKVNSDINRAQSKLARKLALKPVKLPTSFLSGSADTKHIDNDSINVPRYRNLGDVIDSASDIVRKQVSFFDELTNRHSRPRLANIKDDPVIKVVPEFATSVVKSASDLVGKQINFIDKVRDARMRNDLFNRRPYLLRSAIKTDDSRADALDFAPKLAHDMTTSLSSLVNKKIKFFENLADSPSFRNVFESKAPEGRSSLGISPRRSKYRSNSNHEAGREVVQVLKHIRNGIVDVLAGDQTNHLARADDPQESETSIRTRVTEIPLPKSIKPKPIIATPQILPKTLGGLESKPQHLIISKQRLLPKLLKATTAPPNIDKPLAAKSLLSKLRSAAKDSKFQSQPRSFDPTLKINECDKNGESVVNCKLICET